MAKVDDNDDFNYRDSSTPCITTLYLNGNTYVVYGLPSESFNKLELRRSWIEKRIHKSKDYSIENTIKYIKLSIFWYNYIHYGAQYPNVVSEEQYKEWTSELPEKIEPPEDQHNRK